MIDHRNGGRSVGLRAADADLEKSLGRLALDERRDPVQLRAGGAFRLTDGTGGALLGLCVRSRDDKKSDEKKDLGFQSALRSRRRQSV